LKASLKLITSSYTKKGHPLVVELFISSKDRPRETIAHTPPEYWDAENEQLLKQHPYYQHIVPTVLEYKAKCIKVNHGKYTVDEAKEIIFNNNDELKPLGLIEFFNIRIEEKKNNKKPFQSYSNVKHVLELYISPKQDIPMNHITYEWLNTFKLFKLQDGCKMGGVMSYFRTIKAVYKEAQRRTSLKVKNDNPFLGVMETVVAKEVLDISKKQFQSLLNFEQQKGVSDVNHSKQLRNIKLLLFQYYIGGHDLVDVSMLEWNKIKNSRVKFKRYKNRDRPGGGPLVDNVVHPEAQKIINDIGTPDDKRVFSFIPNKETNSKQYQTFQRNLNRSYKSICKTLKIPKLTTKSTRYIYRTFASELEIYDLTLYKIMGHKPKGISFNYQGKMSHKKIDAALSKMVKYTKI
jgi:hypothetical protein